MRFPGSPGNRRRAFFGFGLWASGFGFRACASAEGCEERAEVWISILEALTRGNDEEQGQDAVVRVELKYCEHCGGLWLRECGAGTVYCESCTQRVADLPIPKKRAGRVTLPVRRRTVVENYETKMGDRDMEAAGGAA